VLQRYAYITTPYALAERRARSVAIERAKRSARRAVGTSPTYRVFCLRILCFAGAGRGWPMATGKVVVCVALAVLTTLPRTTGAFAQEATDADLRAAYCLKVIQDRLVWSQVCTRVGLPPALAEVNKQSCATENNSVARLKAYLTARGYVFAERDLTPVIVAANRGGADFRDCVIWADSPESTTCFNKCWVQGGGATCIANCPVSEACRRVQSCSDLTFLPF
jgi:hypothetical protein